MHPSLPVSPPPRCLCGRGPPDRARGGTLCCPQSRSGRDPRSLLAWRVHPARSTALRTCVPAPWATLCRGFSTRTDSGGLAAPILTPAAAALVASPATASLSAHGRCSPVCAAVLTPAAHSEYNSTTLCGGRGPLVALAKNARTTQCHPWSKSVRSSRPVTEKCRKTRAALSLLRLLCKDFLRLTVWSLTYAAFSASLSCM